MSEQPEELLKQAEQLAKTEPKRAEQIYNQILSTYTVCSITLLLTKRR